LAAISFTPKQIAKAIQQEIPDFVIKYAPDYRQHIADSWPNSIDDSVARIDWQWEHDFNLKALSIEMLQKLKKTELT